MTWFRRIGRFEIIAFATGFALMAYELAASRILAPTIGSSTYVWTSVIGVIIAALSAGYAVGGIIADRRVAARDIALLLLASALCIVMTLTFAPGTLALLAQSNADPRLQGLLASLSLFMPASFVLGMISPYLARLRVHTVNQTGRAVASLSALNALGGIVGTFCVGFLLFGYMGSKETLIAIIILLVAASWLVVPRYRRTQRVIFCLILVMLVVLQLIQKPQPQLVADVDTATSRYKVVDSTAHNRPIRTLVMGPGSSQSSIYLDNANELVYRYTRSIAKLIEQVPQKQRVLVLGGGAMTLPTYVARTHPAMQVDVVEIDPQLTTIASEYFQYKPLPNLRIINQDARAFLAANPATYDIIVVDVYNDDAVPFALTTVEYTAGLRRTLQPNGVVAVNAIGGLSKQCAPLFTSLHRSYIESFTHYKVLPQITSDLRQTQNIVMVYGNGLDWLSASRYDLPPGQRLTDNFAPVERLKVGC